MNIHHKAHYRRLHLRRISWFAFLFISLFAIQISYYAQMTKAVNGVLAYATSMSVGDLLASTNQQRAANGLGPLALNGSLNIAAQNKAQHMIDIDYWAHVAPDGTTPWYWFDLSGYNYINAGENLAYGFSTSASTVQAWMDSPGHRANILGDYKDVGFGFVNGANFQGGQYTVIVAHYGTTNSPQAPAAAPPPPPAPVQTSSPLSAPATAPKPSAAPPTPALPAAPPAPVEQPPADEPEKEDSPIAPAGASGSSPPPPSQNAPANEERVTSVQAALTGRAAWPFYASMAAVAVTSIGFISTHMQILSYAWHRGIRFAGLHPMFDAAVVGAVTLLVMTATVGFIK